MTPGKAMEAQFFFQRRLKERGVTIHFIGTADSPEQCIPTRWELIRASIADFGLADAVFGQRADGTKETYQQAFERATGQPLIPAKSEAAA
jgi:hypothetical protein